MSLGFGMIFVNSNTILISAVDTALASLCSAFFQESEGQRDNTLKGFFAYAVEIAVSDTKRNLLGEKAGISRGWSVGVVENV